MNSGSRTIRSICSRCSGRNDEVQHSIAFRSGVGDTCTRPRCTCSGCSNLNSGSCAICTISPICSRRSGRNDEVQHSIAFRSGVGDTCTRPRCTCSGCSNLNSGSCAICTISPICSRRSGRNDEVQHSIAFRSGVGDTGFCSRCTCGSRADLYSGSRAIRTSCTIRPRCSGRNDEVQHGVAFRSSIGNARICPRCTCGSRANLNSGSRAIRTSCTISPRCPSRNDEVQHSIAFRSGVGDARICSRCTCGSRADLDSGSRAIRTISPICSRRPSRNDEV